MKDSKLKFNRNAEDKFVNMLHNYSEAITGANAEPHDFYPSDDEDRDANIADTERRSNEDDIEQGKNAASNFFDTLYEETADFVRSKINDYLTSDNLDDFDEVVEYLSDASSNEDLDRYGFANFLYEVMKDEMSGEEV